MIVYGPVTIIAIIMKEYGWPEPDNAMISPSVTKHKSRQIAGPMIEMAIRNDR